MDVTAPQTTISGGPPARTRAATARLTFRATESGSTFECKLDEGASRRCTSPQSYKGINKGSHTFQVRATDGAGNKDATPAKRVWRRT